MASKAYSGYSFRRRLEDDCMSDTHEGGCLCGKVRYRLTGNPDETEGAGICHCTNCRRRTGSAFGVQVFFPKDAFQLTKGELKTYEYRSDVDRWVRTEFCRNCGTTVTWLAEPNGTRNYDPSHLARLTIRPGSNRRNGRYTADRRSLGSRTPGTSTSTIRIPTSTKGSSRREAARRNCSGTRDRTRILARPEGFEPPTL